MTADRPALDGTTAGAEAPGGGRTAHVAALVRRVPLDRLVLLLAVLPALVMVDVVRTSSDLQAADYWTVFGRVVAPDGELQVRNLLDPHVGHIVAVPGLVYWANWKLFDGLNPTLGVYVLAVAAAQVLVLRAVLPRASRLGRWWAAGLVVGFAVFVFTPQGAHHFGRAMSGTAWLTANLLGLGAIWLAHRGRPLGAVPLAALATVTYGTGLMAWPAVLIVAFLRPGRAWQRWVVVAASVVALGAFAAAYDRPHSQESAATQPNDVLHRTAQVLGTIVSADPEVAVLVGVVGLLGAVVLAGVAVQRGDADAVPWVGVAAYATGGALLIGGARGGLADDTVGVSSRYASSGALLWCAVAVLAVLVLGERAWVAFGGLVVATTCYVGGQQALADAHEFAVDQDALAVAIRMDAASGNVYFPSGTPPEMLEALGHYPYAPSFDTDCGLLGSSVDDRRVRPPARGMSGALDPVPTTRGRYGPPTVELSGYVVSPEADVRCVVFADGSGTVVGAAGYGLERSDLLRRVGAPGGDFDRGFRGPARGPAGSYRAFVVVEGDEALYALPGEVPGMAADDG